MFSCPIICRRCCHKSCETVHNEFVFLPQSYVFQSLMIVFDARSLGKRKSTKITASTSFSLGEADAAAYRTL